MEWRKKLSPGAKETTDIVISIVFVTTLIAFIINQPVLFMVTGLLVSYILVSTLYDKKIGDQLHLHNKKTEIRLFPKEVGEIELNLHHNSHLPIINGQLTFTLNYNVKPINKKFIVKEDEEETKCQVPFSIYKKGLTTIKIPIKAIKRGTTKVQHIEIQFPHIVNFHHITLHFHKPYLTEIIVYPEQTIVHGLNDRRQRAIGEETSPYSLYEDTLYPIGTRGYVPTDSFSRIHWKATARKQSLQTKVYERSQNTSTAVIVNISETSHLGNRYVSPHLEELLSITRYVSQTLLQNGTPTTLFINAKKLGFPPYRSFQFVNGKQDIQVMLECLARIKPAELVTNPVTMAYDIIWKKTGPIHYVFIGTWETEFPHIQQQVKQNDGQMTLVHHEDGETILKGIRT
ncbi:DUF58 domain-containing protein [Salirhabdus salicampi]|uniref:DUF58 domain-containing protein n=1 Tax=Salirhabdus salicampi TaxID=476102 RepID=UPI0020C1CFD5|nr:DUF58 domain-containing protein [Salirhabdus salicampi]MCP8615296.1 DUF58 domain-containing protein [Salirhabdus salicampi]